MLSAVRNHLIEQTLDGKRTHAVDVSGLEVLEEGFVAGILGNDALVCCLNLMLKQRWLSVTVPMLMSAFKS